MNTSDGNDLLQALRRPFPVKRIHWRVGATTKAKDKGIGLAYIDARDAQQRLDDIMGVDWQCRYSHVGDKGVVCEVGLLIDGEWRWRANGAGETDVEGTKGSMSDAFKRAAVMWGVGKYLYALPNEWVPIEPAGRSYKLAGTPSLPSWATPEGYDEAIGRIPHRVAVKDNLEDIAIVKRCVREENMEGAAETFATFSRKTEMALNSAPKFGGQAWTTREREYVTRNPEFTEMVHQFRLDAGWYEENEL
jgi:hypothetical protein